MLRKCGTYLLVDRRILETRTVHGMRQDTGRPHSARNVRIGEQIHKFVERQLTISGRSLVARICNFHASVHRTIYIPSAFSLFESWLHCAIAGNAFSQWDVQLPYVYSGRFIRGQIVLH
jgi:hypothetical protein